MFTEKRPATPWEVAMRYSTSIQVFSSQMRSLRITNRKNLTITRDFASGHLQTGKRLICVHLEVTSSSGGLVGENPAVYRMLAWPWLLKGTCPKCFAR
jgi:hypothetical protein